jgi:hypothetical protein
MIPGSGVIEMAQMNRELNQGATTGLSLSDGDCYRMMGYTYSMANARNRGLVTPTPGGNGSRFVGAPATAICYLTVYPDGRIEVTNGTTQYWWKDALISSRGNGMEVYAAVDYGSPAGDPFWTWLSIGSARQWYISVANGFTETNIQLYFRNGQVAQSSPGGWYMYAESS